MIPLNRHGPAILMRKVRRMFERDLDPARVANVFAEFDDQRGYAAWQAQCRTALKRPLPSGTTPPEALMKNGFSVHQAMQADQAATLLADATGGQQPGRVKRDSAKLEGYNLDDPALLRRLVTAAITPEIDAQCLKFFGSEYFVYWHTLSSTAPVDGPATVSFMWHCDRGPRSHLKLLVYLNDYEEHGGGTSYLDLESTEAVARSGYIFARGRRRTGSIAELSKLAKRELKAYDHWPRAGDAVLFQPSRVLHSGVTPTRAPRYVFTLCLLPSPVPWQAALERSAQVDLRNDPLWHDRARDLAQRF